jgi:pimeloyl-ACP methyl ester carboxylesterase
MRMLIACLILVLGSADALAELNCRFDLELDTKDLAIAEEIKKEVGRHHYILVAGFLNEAMPKYFFDTLESLKKEMGASKVTVIRPSSLHDIERNSADLASRLAYLHHGDPETRFVVIGHSMGAVESFMMAASAPIFDKAVESMVLIQGPFGGSPVADAVTGPAGILLPRKTREKYLAGFQALRTDVSEERMSKVMAIVPERRLGAIQDKVHLVTSYTQNPLKVAASVGITNFFMNFAGKNDGLVMLKHQVVDDMDLDMTTMKDIDHADLVSDPGTTFSLWPQGGHTFRRAFTRAMILKALKLK